MAGTMGLVAGTMGLVASIYKTRIRVYIISDFLASVVTLKMFAATDVRGQESTSLYMQTHVAVLLFFHIIEDNDDINKKPLPCK